MGKIAPGHFRNAPRDLPEGPTAEPAQPPWASFAELQDRVFPPLAWVVPRYLPQGATLLAGRPKLGKSWLALDWAIAVARGGWTLDQKCEEGDVLYLALEDNERRLQARGEKIVLGAWPRRLSYLHSHALAGDGDTANAPIVVRRWLEWADKPRLVIIDTLAKVRPGKGRDEGAYEADYAAVAAWKALADEFEVAIVLVHHVRKMHADDALEMVSGTNGLTGAADTILILNRDGQGVTLGGRGRDIEEFEKSLKFDAESCRWSMLGEASEVRRTDERKVILDALREEAAPMSPREVTDLVGGSYAAIRQILIRMAKAGEVEKVGRGKYTTHPNTCHNHHNVTAADREVEL